MIGVYSVAQRKYWFGRDAFGRLVGPWEDSNGRMLVLGALQHSAAVKWMEDARADYKEYKDKLFQMDIILERNQAISLNDATDCIDGSCIIQNDWLAPSRGFHAVSIAEMPSDQLVRAVVHKLLDRDFRQRSFFPTSAQAVGADSTQSLNN